MTARSPDAAIQVVDIKSASLPLVALVLKTADMAALKQDLDKKLSDAPDAFDQEPVIIDLTALSQAFNAIDFAQLVHILRQHHMQPIAVRGGTLEQMQAARHHGLIETAVEWRPIREKTPVLDESSKAPPQPDQLEPLVAPKLPLTSATLVIEKPLRSGQQIYAKGADLIMLAAVNPGAEVIADGHIHVYAPLRGKAIAGAKGNSQARIFSTLLEPELLSIAGIYRTTEKPLPAEVLGKAAQIRLDGERLVFEALAM